MFPPMGFFGSDANIEAPSTCATTWLVITTATPNYIERIDNKDMTSDEKQAHSLELKESLICSSTSLQS